MKVFADWCVDSDMMSGGAQPDAVFIHCLAAHRGEQSPPGSSTARKVTSGMGREPPPRPKALWEYLLKAGSNEGVMLGEQSAFPRACIPPNTPLRVKRRATSIKVVLAYSGGLDTSVILGNGCRTPISAKW